jgi:Rnl2 family RNA ligase
MFIKFPSIDNHYQEGSTKKWVQRFPELPLSKFIITEKLDGSNLQVIITKDEVQCASRRQMLSISDSFFDYQRTVLVDCKTQIEALQRYIVENNEGVEQIHIYGEIFGEGVQKRIHYMKGKKFLPFEVRLNEKLLSIKEALDLFQSLEIGDWWVPILKIADSLDEALQTEVSDVLTLVEGEVQKDLNRNIEGVVIAPYDNLFAFDNYEQDVFMGESVFRLKKKCKEFNDKMKVKTKEIKVFEGSEEYVRLQTIWNGYFNENRLADLFSKEGPITEMKEIGKYIKLMGDDVKEDFFKEHKEAFILLTDAEKKKIMGSVGQNTLPLLKAVL